MRQAHALSTLLGARMVSSTTLPERRKSEAELRAMAIEDRLIYEMHHPLTDQEKQEALEREDMEAHLGIHGEVHPDLILMNEAPDSEWGD